jgi:hypothetical protein
MSVRELGQFIDSERTFTDRVVSASFNPLIQVTIVIAGSACIARAFLLTERRWLYAGLGVVILSPLVIRNLFVDRYRAHRLSQVSHNAGMVERVRDLLLDMPDMSDDYDTEPDFQTRWA